MTDHLPAEQERRLRRGLERLSQRAPSAFEPPATMLRRARRRVAATAIGTVVVLSAIAVGGVALTRTVAERRPPPIPVRPPTHTPEQGPAVGCAFAPQPLPELPPRLMRVVEASGSFQLADVDGRSPEDVWLAGTIHGDFSKPAVTIGVFLHWNGSSMTVLPPMDRVGVSAIEAIDPDDVWAATGGSPAHWDGTSWSPVGDSYGTIAIAASGPDDVWAVGDNRWATQPISQHFDGSRWALAPTPASLRQPRGGVLSIGMSDVVALGPDDAWAVGGYFFQGQGTERPEPPVVMHWDGDRWSAVDVPTPGDGAYDAYGVAANGPDDLWIAADAIFPSTETTPGVMLHWDGSSWSQVTPTSPRGTVPHLVAVDAGGPDDVWASGSAFDADSDRSIPLIEHFDGSAWTVVPLTDSNRGREGRIRSVRIIGDEVWAVGFSAIDEPPFISVCRVGRGGAG